MTTTSPTAILWDLDGTLVDTEPLWIAAEHELVSAHGGTWTHEDALRLVGNSLSASAAILQEAGVDLPAEEIIAWLIDRVTAAVLEEGPRWRPGVRDLLDQARSAGIPQAIVTMSYRSQAEIVADALPAGTIQAIVAGDTVARGKPDPEAYLTGASLLGVDPRDCLAIEDSGTGVRAALASGAVTVTCPSVIPVPHLPGLGRVDTLADTDIDTLWAVGCAARTTPVESGAGR